MAINLIMGVVSASGLVAHPWRTLRFEELVFNTHVFLVGATACILVSFVRPSLRSFVRSFVVGSARISTIHFIPGYYPMNIKSAACSTRPRHPVNPRTHIHPVLRTLCLGTQGSLCCFDEDPSTIPSIAPVYAGAPVFLLVANTMFIEVRYSRVR